MTERIGENNPSAEPSAIATLVAQREAFLRNAQPDTSADEIGEATSAYGAFLKNATRTETE